MTPITRYRPARPGTRRLVAVVASALALASPAHAATVVNGGFETGNFAGWTVVNQAGGTGNWFVYGGITSPLSAFTIPAPPQGNYGAVTDQFGPGTHVLYQDVALEGGMTHSLSFILYYDNRNGTFHTPSTLGYTAIPNQQYRVDILKPSASPFSVAPADVLLPVFRTNVGDPASLAPTSMGADLTPFGGSTVRIRFAEVDNQFFFQAGVDAVGIQSADIDCPAGLVPTIVGTPAQDAIAAGPGNDVIFGLGGDDLISGGGGNDVICGGAGNDSVAAGDGNDIVYGGPGHDRMSGDAGNDRLFGGLGNDELSGGLGTDRLFGVSGDDTLSGADGAPGDILDGGPHVGGDTCAGDVGDPITTCNP